MPFCTSFLATGELQDDSKNQQNAERLETVCNTDGGFPGVRCGAGCRVSFPAEFARAPALQASPYVFESLTRYGFSDEEIFALVVPRRTFARRQAQNERLTVEETDKALRLARIATQAEIVFGDKNKAHRWLRKPKRSLNEETPLAYLASEAGARTVEEMLNRIEFGVLS